VHATLLKAYRWQYIVSGTLEPRFQKLLGELAGDAQMARIQAALAPVDLCSAGARAGLRDGCRVRRRCGSAGWR
jgi:hypothetical protein